MDMGENIVLGVDMERRRGVGDDTNKKPRIVLETGVLQAGIAVAARTTARPVRARRDSWMGIDVLEHHQAPQVSMRRTTSADRDRPPYRVRVLANRHFAGIILDGIGRQFAHQIRRCAPAKKTDRSEPVPEGKWQRRNALAKAALSASSIVAAAAVMGASLSANG